MFCPYCKHTDSRVLDSRVSEDGASIRRRRQCPSCERRFTTVEQTQLVVVKRSGVVEPFARDKVIAGVRKACKGRPVSEDDLARLGQQVEDSLRACGQAEINAEDVGLAILQPLRRLRRGVPPVRLGLPPLRHGRRLRTRHRGAPRRPADRLIKTV